MPSEFALIERYFTRPAPGAVLGVGDDAAILQPSPGMELLVSTDMLVAGTHFLADTDPEALGWKVLAVNLSDIAAMGGRPRWALLAAALPAATESWIAAFARGFFACADAFAVDVVGGDTTRGPRNFCVSIIGEVPAGAALLRSGARAGDDIWVSGTPGLAALGLAHLQGRCVLAEPALTACLGALQRPRPRIALGLGLRGLASAAIDVSDGLLADLKHILERSGAAATVHFEALPQAALAAGTDADLARGCLLGGGDDYELAFTAAPTRRGEIAALGQSLDLPLARIGEIRSGPGAELRLLDADGRVLAVGRDGYDHFG
jgi:thiamine-monophosphate kinase